MRLLFEIASGGDVGAFARDQLKAMNKAARAAMDDVAEIAKNNGRKSIAAAGFGSKWQNALRSRVYPNPGQNLSPAALIWHRIQYSSVFERGARIAGGPLLWLPTRAVPLGRGSHPLTPSQYAARVGPLRSVNLPGRPPMLFGTSGTIAASGKGAVRVRRRKAVKNARQWVPLYVGVSTVNIPAKFSVERETRLAAEQLPARYAQHFIPG